MTATAPDDQEDKPLDPAMENVRRKMVRLQLVSAGVMLVMLMAVLGTIVYKLTRTDEKAQAQSAAIAVPSEAPVNAVAALPAGFTVTNVALSGSQVLFYGNLPGAEPRAIVFDIAAGRIVADITVRTN
ncbi:MULTISPECIES: hypothetical protein [Ensifer]|jgi:flagellar basal body-associated protein FliL|uniref:Fimbrial protein n=1 Tax=Ensifer canadensis TaxID=555315 RepID=A0AAW4FN28_9HYPH|nr:MULTISPECIES: hypothetical protein [Ensifer]AHK42308.1 hypothetical protein OV14_0195 [Ensifer adhaerens OV14]MDP9631194.1 flagellar basal body-associated protein FliL [Ensifer adhaerens]KQU91225.1 hypothetical protein ASD00_26070 [Ensifer sp. Root31]KQW39681.1 hypothetical protein ASD02_14950 [Ensifer sp. Root1252]KQW59951.1 hypothetical protein ASD03_14625 [Ensifer sp. Root127]